MPPSLRPESRVAIPPDAVAAAVGARLLSAVCIGDGIRGDTGEMRCAAQQNLVSERRRLAPVSDCV